MIQESDIKGYVRLCQQAEMNESPKGKIKAYKKIKELMYNDQEKVISRKRVSPIWIKEWLQAVHSIHEHIDWRDDIDFKIWRDDRFEDVTKIEEIPEWIDCMSVGETTRRFLHEDIGPGSKYRANLSTHKGFQWLNNFFSPELNDNKPEVTPLDVVFYEMLTMIDRRFSNNARLAVVAGEAESEEEAKPSSEYYGGIFYRTIASEIEFTEEELTEEAIEFIREHDPRNEKIDETIKGATLRKKTALPNLEKKIKEYLKRADDIEKKTLDEETKLFAWEQLLNYINNENGAYADEVEESLERAEETIFPEFLERWKLDADNEEWEVGEAVRCFLNAAKEAMNTRTSVDGFASSLNITWGFEWHPIVELYSAQPMLYALIKAIRKDMDYLQVQANFTKKKDRQTIENNLVSKKKETTSRKSKRTIQKQRETMTFKKKSGVLDGHLVLLYRKLTNEDKWIEGEEAHFIALFSGKRDKDCVLTWTGKYGKGTLVELFNQIIEADIIELPKGFTISAILEGHFKDTNGNWLTGLDKGNAANNKALPVIQECIRLLKTDAELALNGDDDDEDFKMIYDPYDHQDLNLHER